MSTSDSASGSSAWLSFPSRPGSSGAERFPDLRGEKFECWTPLIFCGCGFFVSAQTDLKREIPFHFETW